MLFEKHANTMGRGCSKSHRGCRYQSHGNRCLRTHNALKQPFPEGLKSWGVPNWTFQIYNQQQFYLLNLILRQGYTTGLASLFHLRTRGIPSRSRHRFDAGVNLSTKEACYCERETGQALHRRPSTLVPQPHHSKGSSTHKGHSPFSTDVFPATIIPP